MSIIAVGRRDAGDEAGAERIVRREMLDQELGGVGGLLRVDLAIRRPIHQPESRTHRARDVEHGFAEHSSPPGRPRPRPAPAPPDPPEA